MFDSPYGNKNDAIIFSIVENLRYDDFGTSRVLKVYFHAENSSNHSSPCKSSSTSLEGRGNVGFALFDGE